MNKKIIKIILLIFIFIISACKNYETLSQQFLIDNPEYKLFINGEKIDKYKNIIFYPDENPVIGIMTSSGEYGEVCASGGWKNIPNTDISCCVADTIKGGKTLYFYKNKPIRK